MRFTALMLMLAATACTHATAPVQQRRDDAAGAVLAERHRMCTALINDAKLDEVERDCVAADYTRHAVAGRPEVKGADGLLEWLRSRRSAMSDWHLAPQLIMVAGRDVLAVELATGTHTGPLRTSTQEIAATNSKTGQLVFHRLAMTDEGRVRDEWAYADEATLLSQLGVTGMPRRPPLEQGWDGAPIVVVSAGDERERRHLEVVQQNNDAFLENKPAALLALYSDDIVDMGHGDQPVRGKAELEQGFTAFRNVWLEVRVLRREAWAAGDYVVQTFTFEGKHNNGKTMSFDVAQVLRFRDGKIERIWAF